ncbi:MAG: hypothetical protein HC767_14595 [Akkermansiaceae bacterium]|nr:hypothetical protein [Akkermansiaceae bacterium]
MSCAEIHRERVVGIRHWESRFHRIDWLLPLPHSSKQQTTSLTLQWLRHQMFASQASWHLLTFHFEFDRFFPPTKN